MLTFAVFAAACSGDVDDSGSAEPDDFVRPDEGVFDVPVEQIVAALSDGLGTLDADQQDAVAGVADGDGDCDDHRAERARPLPSQIEVEVIAVVDDCLQFSYDVANFRSFVDDVRRIRQRPGVVAASPLLLDYRINEIESQWPIGALGAEPFLGRTNSPTGAGVIVAVIDSGIDVDDAALEGIALRRVPDSGTGDYVATGHGTIAASIIVAPIGSAERGLAPEVELLDVPADLCDPDACGCDPCATMTPAEAIRWSVDNGADIISMSFGYQPTVKPTWWQILIDAEELGAAVSTMEVALFYAELQGVAMVGAAGNCASGPSVRCEVEDQFEIPAGHQSVVAVGAITADEDGIATRASYSTRQSYVELVAPGNLVVVDGDGERHQKSGTSFATPFVSAAMAVLLGDDGPLAGRPDARDEARQVLAATAIDLGPDGRDIASGHGQMQLDAALAAAEAFAAANPHPSGG